MEWVSALRTHYLSDNEYKDEHLVSLGVVSPQGATLIPRSWGKVDDLFTVAQLLAQLLAGGFFVSADLRADRLLNRPIMFTVDLDPVDPSKQPQSDNVLSLFHDALGDVLTGEDCRLTYSRNVLVTQNISKPGSLHLYYYNIWAPHEQIKQVARYIKETVGDSLLSLGFKFDLHPYNMGTLRWPYTYAFKHYPGQPDSRHVAIGFYSGREKLNHKKVQQNSPFVNCFDGDLRLIPDMLSQFWRGLFAEPVHPHVMPAPRKLARAISETTEAAGEIPDEIDRSACPPIDMMDTTTVFNYEEFREVVEKHNKDQETYAWLCQRVAMVDTSFFFKTRGVHGIVVKEKSYRELVNGAWNVLVVTAVGERGKKKKESVWAWYKTVCRCYDTHACIPRFVGVPISDEIAHVFNTWCGFVGYPLVASEDFLYISLKELVDDYDLSFFLWFVHQVIFNKSTAIFYRWMMWLRLLFVEPSVPVGIIPLIVGPGGLGKSLLFSFLQAHVLGDAHSCILEKADTLAQRFNGFSGRLSVCFIDESATLTEASLNTLKFSSTSKGSRPIEAKGKEVTFSGPAISFALSANDNKTPLPRDERRLLVANSDPAYGSEARDADKEIVVMHWKDLLTDERRCKSLAKMFLCYLLRYVDCAEFIANRNKQIFSPGYVAMRKNGHSHFEQFWDECLSTMCNARNNIPFDGSISTKITWSGGWATHIPFEAVKQHWFDFNLANRGGNRKSNTLRENLVKVAEAKFEFISGTLWITFPSHRHCKELFTVNSAIDVDVAGLKYEDHSKAWKHTVDGLEPTEDAAFFTRFSFVCEPVPVPNGEQDERSGDDDSDGSSDNSSFQY